MLARALAVQEVNAAMGVIVAAPTAGGAGVLPAVLTGLADARGIGDDAARRRARDRRPDRRRRSPSARRSPAPKAAVRRRPAPRPAWPPALRPRCSAERRRRSGTPSRSRMQGTLGLVCDPLGGLVELPCVFRNATGAAIALAGIEMAMAGVDVRDPGGRGDRRDGRDRRGDGRALSRDRGRRARRDADGPPAGAGAARADQASGAATRSQARVARSFHCRTRVRAVACGVRAKLKRARRVARR